MPDWVRNRLGMSSECNYPLDGQMQMVYLQVAIVGIITLT